MVLNSDLEDYLLNHVDSEDEILAELNRQTHLKVVHPRMLSGHLQGTLLKMISHMIRPEMILEIGTYTGYSAICLTEGLQSNGKLHTIEIMDELHDFPIPYWEKAGIKDKIVQHTGDALEIIPSLPYLFDLVFIDGEKKQYNQYFEVSLSKLKPGGFILIDNILWGGKVIGSDYNDVTTRIIREFNDKIAHDKRIQKTILPVRDGLFLLRKNNIK